MKVDISTALDCSAEKAWRKVQTSALLLHVIWPLARIVPVGQKCFPDTLPEGSAFQCRSYVFGFIPLGVRTIVLERIDQTRLEIQSREQDPMIQKWDHLISIRPKGENRCIYRDEIEIQAGLFTFVVWLWANWFYRHRQARWRVLARSL